MWPFVSRFSYNRLATAHKRLQEEHNKLLEAGIEQFEAYANFQAQFEKYCAQFDPPKPDGKVIQFPTKKPAPSAIEELET